MIRTGAGRPRMKSVIKTHWASVRSVPGGLIGELAERRGLGTAGVRKA